MRPRQTVVEQFSSLARITDRGFHGWICEPRLQKSMQQQLQMAAEAESKQGDDGDHTAERYWSLYWHHAWQTQSHRLAEEHLVAYLQEPCYWVAQEIYRKVLSIRGGAPSSSTVLDYFQMALVDLRPVLEKFSPDRSSNLKAFVQTSLSVRLKSTLRQRHEVDFCTPWGLLRKTSKKRLLEVLEAQGLSPNEIDQSRLLMEGFKALYAPLHAGGGAKLPKPDEQLWQTLAEFYNQKRHGLLNSPGPQLQPSDVQPHIENIARWIRRYFYPPIDSLNQPRSRSDGETGELMDKLPAETPGAYSSAELSQHSLVDKLVADEQATERHQTQVQVHKALATAFSQLSEQKRTVLYLWYCEGLNQTAISEQVKVSQATVSRRITAARQDLLTALLHWTEQTMNRKPKPEQLTGIATLLGDWLKVYLREANLHL